MIRIYDNKNENYNLSEDNQRQLILFIFSHRFHPFKITEILNKIKMSLLLKLNNNYFSI